MIHGLVEIISPAGLRSGEFTYSSATQVALTGTAAETTLATITIPAGSIGANGKVLVTTLWSCIGTNTKNARVRLGGASGTVYSNPAITTQTGGRMVTEISNKNSASSQIGNGASASGTGFGSFALVTSSVDTSAATTIVITGQLTNTGETIALEGYSVQIIYRA